MSGQKINDLTTQAKGEGDFNKRGKPQRKREENHCNIVANRIDCIQTEVFFWEAEVPFYLPKKISVALSENLVCVKYTICIKIDDMKMISVVQTCTLPFI